MRPEDIPKRLDAATLDQVMQEARFLLGHAVDVRELEADEEPGIPKPANGSEEPPLPVKAMDGQAAEASEPASDIHYIES